MILAACTRDVTGTQYRCAQCGETYETGWSEEEAQAVLAATFPRAEPTECDVVCEDCYKKLMRGIFQ